MSATFNDLGTDAAWEEWGRRDPYYGVITDPKFRRSVMTEKAKREFFESGQTHVEYVMRMLHTYISPGFAPTAILDFGCGVGRTLIPFSGLGPRAVGMDVSPSMLLEARRNCDERKIENVTLVPSDDALTSLTGSFDLIHSFIVFQHIAPQRGKVLFANLLAHLAPGGLSAVHFGYAKRPTPGAPIVEAAAQPIAAPPTAAPPIVGSRNAVPPIAAAVPVDPEMQMNLYPVTELFVILQNRGVHHVHLEFTDHGGELGVFLFFAVPSQV
jgi:SAM-dependent methyltransferase